jgi:hypothetical protein
MKKVRKHKFGKLGPKNSLTSQEVYDTVPPSLLVVALEINTYV